MSDKSDLLGRLRDLRDLSKGKHFQLSNPEQEEAFSVLSELCTTHEDDYDDLIEALAELPSEVGAQVLSQHWKKLLEAPFPVIRDLMKGEFDSDQGKRLRISLAQRLMVNYPDSALEVLYASFQRIRPDRGPLPTIQDLWIIRNALINTGYNSLKQLPLQEPEQARLIIAYILAAAFTHRKSRKALPEQVQIEVLNWANLFQEVPPLPTEIHALIQQTVNTWSRDSLASLAQSVDSFQPTIRDTLADLFPRSGGRNPSPAPEALPSLSAQPTPALPPPSSEMPPYDPLKAIEQLGNYIKDITGQLEQTLSDLEKANLDFRKIQTDLQIARNACGNAEREASDLRHSNRRLAAEKDSLKEEIEKLESALDELRKTFDAAQSEHERAVAVHGEHLDTLSERIEREGEQRIGIFRNALGAKVQRYANDLNDAIAMEMTIDLGVALRNQMRQLVQLLKSEGVRISGGT